MIPGIIGKHISRANRNLLITNVFLLIVLVLVTYAMGGVLYNFFKGPREINVSEIPKLGDPDSIKHNWFSVTIDKGEYHKGVYEIPHRKGATAYFRLLELPEGALLIENDKQDFGKHIEGRIAELSGEGQTKALPEFIRVMATTPVLRVMIKDTSIRTGTWVFFGICGPLFLLAVWNIVKAVKRMGNPASHPVCNVLKRFGPPEEIAVGIDAEYQAGTQATGNVQLTNSWLMRKKTYGLDLVFLGDVVWAYKKETKHSTNGVPTGTTYSSMIYDKHGASLDLGLKKDQTEQLLGNISRAVPWVVLGFDQELANMWAKNRGAMLTAVEARKESYLAAAKREGAQADN